jgi:hypothetical protein
MKGSGPWAELIGQRFRKALERIGFNRETGGAGPHAFRPPSLHGQGALF